MARNLYIRDKKNIIVHPFNTLGWRLRDMDAIFQAWWRKQGKASIFFTAPPKETQGMQEQAE
jgi:hypothetical protein